MNNAPPLIYIASPYTAPDTWSPVRRQNLQQQRFDKVAQSVSVFYEMGLGGFFYSPIVHSHPLPNYNTVLASWGSAEWRTENYRWLSRCDAIAVLTVDGWHESVGVNDELEYANENDIPQFFYTKERSLVAQLQDEGVLRATR